MKRGSDPKALGTSVWRQHDVIEEERRQLGPARKPGLFVHDAGVLPHRTLAPAGECGDLLVSVTLEQHERDLALGRR